MTSTGREPSVEEKFEHKRRAWSRRPAIIQTVHGIHRGDARTMAELGSRPLVHLIVTSPPYWNLKAYPDQPNGQLGNLADYAEFLTQLGKV